MRFAKGLKRRISRLISLASLLALVLTGTASGAALADTGDIGSIIDTLEFDTTRGNEPSMASVSGDVYAILQSRS